jgi:hypothetical protein
MKFLLLITLTIFMVGCEGEVCNVQTCDSGVMVFYPCRGNMVILHDVNGSAISCKED